MKTVAKEETNRQPSLLSHCPIYGQCGGRYKDTELQIYQKEKNIVDK